MFVVTTVLQFVTMVLDSKKNLVATTTMMAMLMAWTTTTVTMTIVGVAR